MGFHQALGQRESDPGMAVLPGRQSLEHLKYTFSRGRRNAGTVVRYRQFTVPADVLRTNADVSGRSIVVLNRITDDIAQHALERRFVRHERCRIDLYGDMKAGR